MKKGSCRCLWRFYDNVRVHQRRLGLFCKVNSSRTWIPANDDERPGRWGIATWSQLSNKVSTFSPLSNRLQSHSKIANNARQRQKKKIISIRTRRPRGSSERPLMPIIASIRNLCTYYIYIRVRYTGEAVEGCIACIR